MVVHGPPWLSYWAKGDTEMATAARRVGDRVGEDRDEAERERIRALMVSGTALRDLIDATTAIIYVKGLDGRYLLVNRRYEQLTGMTRDVVEGKTDAELWPAAFAAAVRANDLRVLDALQPLEFEERGPDPTSPVTFLAFKFPLFDAHGEPYAIAGISTDITHRKIDEARLRESEERFR